MPKRRVLTDEEWDLLTPDEVAHFSHRAIDAHKFESSFLVVIPLAGIISIVAYALDSMTWAFINGACCVGFIIVAWVGIDLHHARFNRLLFEAIDKHKNGTS